MDRGRIPGFYRDPATGKYYKEIPNHLATRDNRFAKGNVAKLREEAKRRDQIETHAKSVRQQRIPIDPVLARPLAGGIGLGRELDSLSRPGRRSVAAEAFADGLTKQPSMTVVERTDRSRITHFVRDPALPILLLSVRYQRASGIYSYLERENVLSLEDPLDSEITAMDVTPSRTFVTSQYGSQHGPHCVLMRLPEPSEYDSAVAAGSTLGRVVASSVRLRFNFSDDHDESVFCAAANPFVTGGKELIAFGRNQSVNVITIQASGSIETSSGFFDARQKVGDTLAVEWMFPDVFLAGQRNGRVYLFDTRTGASELRFRHAATVTGMKRLDEHNIVVNGLRNSLCQYDTRKMPAPESRAELSRSLPPGALGAPPVLSFDGPCHSRTDLGFDVSKELGLVAAAGEDCALHMYSLTTGRRVRTLDSSRPPARTTAGGSRTPLAEPDIVSTVKFEEDSATRLLGLTAAVGNKIVRWTW